MKRRFVELNKRGITYVYCECGARQESQTVKLGSSDF